MLKKHLGLIALLLGMAGPMVAQVSLFTWDIGTDERIAVVGPNAVASGANASCAAPGSGGSPQGVQPGCSCWAGTCASACRTQINIRVPNTGGIFDLGSMRFSIDYRRTAANNEVDGWFFSRGTGSPTPDYFGFGLRNNKLAFKFRTSDGAGGSTHYPASGHTECWGCPALVSAAIPNDGVWHNYAFEYIASLGTANIYIDGVLNFTEFAIAGRDLYWTGAPAEVNIGVNMDGGGGERTSMLDNARVEDILLPVTLTAFEAQAGERSIHLAWQTASENNSKEFRLYRSSDHYNEVYSIIGTVPASGNTDDVTDYTFVDENPRPGVNYYRLVEVDLDGKEQGLGVRMAQFIPTESGILELYPNPIEGSEKLQLTYNIASSSVVHVRVIDMSGRVMEDLEMEAATGLQQIQIPTEVLQKGVYIVQLSSNGRTWNEKFVRL